MKTTLNIVSFVLQIVGMAVAFLGFLLLVDWLSRSIVADVLTWIAFLVGPILGLRWALK